jgi:SHS2 domain-containing protein
MRDEPAVRGHEILAHTADAGIAARAPGLPALFEEAAAALGELAADVEPGAPRDRVPVELTASDVVALAYDWLNELIGLADARSAAVAGTRVEELAVRSAAAGPRAHRDDLRDRPDATVLDADRAAPNGEPDGGKPLVLRAMVELVRHDHGARPRLEVKSATYHRLAVEEVPGGGWKLTAYLDV